ncbi:Mitochondrial fission protein [Tilletia horrida]|nr:Mitochondrial fission protein [Tilletia horrida]
MASNPGHHHHHHQHRPSFSSAGPPSSLSSSAPRDPVTSTVSGAFTEALAHTRAYLHPFATAAANTTSSTANAAAAAVSSFTSGIAAAPSAIASSASAMADPSVTAQAEHTRILADVAPHLLRPRILNAAIASGAAERAGLGSSSGSRTFTSRAILAAPTQLSLTHPARSLAKISAAIRHGPITSNQLRVLESADQILTALSASQSVAAGSASSSSQHAIAGLGGPAGLLEDSVASLALVDDAGPGGIASQVSLLDGFNATLPSALQGRTRRRKARASHRPHMGLKAMGDSARGLLTDSGSAGGEPTSAAESAASATFETKEARKARKAARGASLGKDAAAPLTASELEAQVEDIRQDKERLNVRRMLLTAEITEVDTKIAALEAVRNDLHRGLVGMREEELELDEELTGVSELLEIQRLRSAMPGGEKASVSAGVGSSAANAMNTGSTRRRRGPLFLPSEHDDLPSQVAFMTLQPATLGVSHHSAPSSSAGPITALDFSEPYGTLVSASAATDGAVRVWDLSTGEEVGRLRGHGSVPSRATGGYDAANDDSAVSQSVVKCLQVEDALCVTGGADASVRVWDLRRVEEHEVRLRVWAEGGHADRGAGGIRQGGGAAAGGDNDVVVQDEDGVLVESVEPKDEFDPCVSRLEGHSKEVTALYFDDNCLVTGASDKTLRQWDLNTGQCVLTMDILWAISNPSSAQALSGTAPGGGAGPRHSAAADLGSSMMMSPSTSPRFGRQSLGAYDEQLSMSMSTLSASGAGGIPNWAGAFSCPTPAYADGSWEMYTDFVGPGALQFWGYALASGSGDGAVRMWDMRTGQAHRTLLGHTAPVTCLQFDETHVISGSLDKSVRIWDLRMGAISDVIKYEFPVTALQFDTRKIVVAAGENALRVFNRTTLQQTPLMTNGHMAPAERLRYMDRYAVSGGKDSVIKVWAL